MLIPLSLAETKALNWRDFQAWFGFTKFQPTIVLQQLQSHKHSSHWNVFTSALLQQQHFCHYFRCFKEDTTRELKTVMIPFSQGTEPGSKVGDGWNMHLSLKEYLQNTGQRRAKVGGQKEWEATASREWASPTLPEGPQTQSQWPKRPAKEKRNSHRTGVLFRPLSL